jgi:acyl-CoA synthetase (AMP-forming)/AMP-acid ligase II
MSEVCGIGTLLRRDDHAAAAHGKPHLFGAVGRPSILSAVRVLNTDGTDAAPNEVGEVVFLSPYIMKGYNREPDRTAQTVRDGWVHSGDVGRFDDDGYLFIVDRMKDLIIRGGQNIAPREIEDRLHAHPDITEAAVVGVPDTEWGEAVVAVVVPKDGIMLEPEDLRAWCADGGLASIKVPGSFVGTDTLPKNLMGKIDKRLVREIASARVQSRDPVSPA